MVPDMLHCPDPQHCDRGTSRCSDGDTGICFPSPLMALAMDLLITLFGMIAFIFGGLAALYGMYAVIFLPRYYRKGR